MKKSKKLSLELREVHIRIHGQTLADNLSLRVRGGETLTIMGESGTGKSTLLGFICGTLGREFETEGRVLLDGEDITGHPPEQRRIGILFQDDLLFPHLSVAENLAFGLAAGSGRLRARRARREKIEEALAHIGMAGFGERDPATLSGGQRARVTMMRTLLALPKAVLLDEPFNKLDASLRLRFRRFVFSHIREGHLPCILVTHDREDAKAARGKISVLHRHGKYSAIDEKGSA